jgi:CRISPR-associated protein (TIGR02584 family)
MDPHHPERYPKRTLLAVTGLSPQVLTETLYALTQRQHPAFVPTEIHVITTAEGAEHARLNLLSDEPGWFDRLRRDYGLAPIAFDPTHVHVLVDGAGTPLADIRTPEQNEQAADQITELVRTFTADPASAVHVSIAGGRKTMGYYLGYALSLFGRPQDRLSHVLVSAPFESHPEFYYPTPAERVIHTQDEQRRPIDCRNAEVTLAEIAFVRLREGLPERLLRGQASLGQSVAAAQRALEPPELIVDLTGQALLAGGEPVPMPAADLAFYAMMARRRKQGMHAARWDTDGLAQQYLVEYRRIAGELSADLERAEAALAEGMDAPYFEQRKSRTNATLREHLGPQLAAPYLIAGDGRRPRMRFGLRIEPEAIHFTAIDPDAGTSADTGAQGGSAGPP